MHHEVVTPVALGPVAAFMSMPTVAGVGAVTDRALLLSSLIQMKSGKRSAVISPTISSRK